MQQFSEPLTTSKVINQIGQLGALNLRKWQNFVYNVENSGVGVSLELLKKAPGHVFHDLHSQGFHAYLPSDWTKFTYIINVFMGLEHFGSEAPEVVKKEIKFLL